MFRTLTALFLSTTMAQAAPNVVTDITPIQSMTAKIMGDLGDSVVGIPVGADPHGWLATVDAKVWATAIADKLSTLDPENAPQYAANLAPLEESLVSLSAEVQEGLNDLPRVVWPHDAYQYLKKRFGLTAYQVLAAYDGETPGPQTVKDLKAKIAEIDLVCMLDDHTTTTDMGNLLAEGTEAKVMQITPLG